MNNQIKETKEKNLNLKTEAYKINLDIDTERIIYEELLCKSNNKSGLVKDALSMYLVMIKKHGYVSPFLTANTTDWDAILNNLSVDGDIGRPAQQVKQQIIEQPVQEQTKETVSVNINDFDYEDEDLDFGDDDNDVDF